MAVCNGFVTLIVHDYKKQFTFYKEVLKLPVQFYHPQHGAGFHIGNLQLILRPETSIDDSHHINQTSDHKGAAIISFTVKEISKMLTALKNDNVKIRQDEMFICERQMILAFIEDFEGNELCLMEQMSLSIEELMTAQADMMVLLQSKTQALEKIRASNESLISKWQMLLEVLLTSQMAIIKNFGFSEDQKGLSYFNEILMNAQKQHPQIEQQNMVKWNFVLEKSFGITTNKTLTLHDARKLIADISEAMMAEPFLSQIDSIVRENEEEQDFLAKRKQLLLLILPLHRRIFEKHGFMGEVGYIEAQKALLEHYFDQEIISKSQTAQAVIFKRAGL